MATKRADATKRVPPSQWPGIVPLKPAPWVSVPNGVGSGKGRITFWGEMDRQHVLPAKDPEVGRRAVREVARHLYDPAGGIIAQFELSPGSHGPTAIAIFEEWDRVEAEARASFGQER